MIRLRHPPGGTGEIQTFSSARLRSPPPPLHPQVPACDHAPPSPRPPSAQTAPSADLPLPPPSPAGKGVLPPVRTLPRYSWTRQTDRRRAEKRPLQSPNKNDVVGRWYRLPGTVLAAPLAADSPPAHGGSDYGSGPWPHPLPLLTERASQPEAGSLLRPEPQALEERYDFVTCNRDGGALPNTPGEGVPAGGWVAAPRGSCAVMTAPAWGMWISATWWVVRNPHPCSLLLTPFPGVDRGAARLGAGGGGPTVVLFRKGGAPPTARP